MRSAVLLLALLALSCVHHPAPGTALPGVLDLRNVSLSEPVELGGVWHFYPGSLGRKGEPVEFPMPAAWNEVLSLPAHGCGTLYVRIQLPPVPSLALRLPDIATSHRVRMNGVLVSETGTVACEPENAVPRMQPLVLPIPDGPQLELEIEMANFADRRGGVRGPIFLGTHADLERARLEHQGLEGLFAGAMILLGVYHLCLFGFRPSERSTLYFGIFCLLIGFRSLLVGERWTLSAVPQFPFWLAHRAAFMGGYAALPMFIHFFHALHKDRLSVWPERIFGAAGWALCLVLFLPAHIFTRSLSVYNALSLAAVAYVLWETVRLSWKGDKEARLGLAGILVLASCALIEILGRERILRPGMYVPVALTSFLFWQSLILARRFSRSFEESETSVMRVQALDRLKEDFLAGISRELHTPLHGIIGSAEHLLSTGGMEQHRGALETIRYSARRLNSLVQDILDFSRLRRNDIHLDLRPVDLRAAAALVFDTSGALARRRGLELRNSLPERLAVLADEFRLQQVLFTLMGAVVQEMEAGYVEIGGYEKDGRVTIEARCSGRGTLGAALAQMNSGPADNSASAISLSIAKALIELHGSKLDLMPAGGGTVFRFSLPAADLSGSTGTEPPPVWSAPASSGAEQQAVIFIVDDEEINAAIVSAALSMYSDVQVFSSARAALDAIERGVRPDLMLLDIMMPGMNGIEMCTELRKRYSPFEVPVIFLSALETGKTVSLALNAGANDYLTQPFEREELLARVRSQILLGRLARENFAMARRELAMSRLIGQERARVYRDLHDGVASDLNTILMAVRMMRRTAPSTGLLDSIEKSALNGLGEIRDLVNTDDEGSLTFGYFSVWLQSLLREAGRASGMTVDLSFERRLDDSQLPFGVSAHLKKICREIIQNILKHAEATVLRAALYHAEDGFRLQIADNGRGFKPDDITYGTGLRSMEKRALESGIILVRHSAPGSGTTYDIRIPGDLMLADANHPNGGLTFFGSPP